MRTRTAAAVLDVLVLSRPEIVHVGLLVARRIADGWPGRARTTVSPRPGPVAGPAVVVLPVTHRGPVPAVDGPVGLVVYGARPPAPEVVAAWRVELCTAGAAPVPSAVALGSADLRARGLDAFSDLALAAVLDDLG